ncbi:DUF2225 domain-containing protein [Clostridium sp. DJ247]|uniref:DUF2225 domain-containing protein n=1 Tax=Clostridium sp. DJ247 TaxID=2726188 RepID=UPI00162484C3|nr:DUF2225 domain-containing protein [Clostridium sp. DJ247]MBC2582228.1 DUF2225 domain-containing protein [Clostridium sp. DJ247]
MSKDIFSGLEDFGFDDIDNIDLYKKENNKNKVSKEELEQSKDKQKSLLYDVQVTCPVCENSFKARAIKTSSYRVLGRDSDSFVRYSVINPYFYDVWICGKCGYSAMKGDFHKIRNYHAEAIKQKVSPKWRNKSYPEIYDINIAIERYKLSLLNYVLMEAKASKKAMNCLKLAWMYRLMEDEANELTFLKQALEGFNEAFYNEDFPIYEMNKFSCMYLIGELNRRVGNNDEALIWFSRVISTPGAPQKLKDRTRDQRDLIKESESQGLTDESQGESKNDKKGFFSRFFK